jgi:hypothetical protein
MVSRVATAAIGKAPRATRACSNRRALGLHLDEKAEGVSVPSLRSATRADSQVGPSLYFRCISVTSSVTAESTRSLAAESRAAARPWSLGSLPQKRPNKWVETHSTICPRRSGRSRGGR